MTLLVLIAGAVSSGAGVLALLPVRAARLATGIIVLRAVAGSAVRDELAC